MSGLVMGLVWELPLCGEFDKAEKYILLAYADHADQNGKNIFPSVDLICEKTGYAERAVQLTTRTLEKLGYLVPDGMGPSGTNRFRIPVDRTDGGAKIAPLLLENAPPDVKECTRRKCTPQMSKNAPEGNAPEGNAPEKEVVVKDSTTTTTAPTFENISYPTSIPEADKNLAIRVYRDICGVFPAEKFWAGIVDSVVLISQQRSENIHDFLKPFWIAWSTRIGSDGQTYNPLNPAWLTEWAISGQIPPAKGDKKHAPAQPTRGQKPKSEPQPQPATYSDADRRAAERIKARRQVQV